MFSLETAIQTWLHSLRLEHTLDAADIEELEDHLREQIAALTDAGLSPDEAFLVAVKRMGSLDVLSREFALEHSDRLWKQLVMPPADTAEQKSAGRRDALVAFGVAVAAAVFIKVPALFGLDFDEDTSFYVRNMSLFVLPLLTGYFVWKRRVDTGTLPWLGAAFVGGR